MEVFILSLFILNLMAIMSGRKQVIPQTTQMSPDLKVLFKI